MKLQTVKIAKFKCLENFEAEVKGKNILLLADNGKGKSSFMQIIRIALGDNTCIPPDAEGSGVVVMDKNGKALTFKVKMKDGKASIKVEGEDIYIDDKKGAISALVGALDFDINEFVEWSKTKAGQKKQVEKFKEFLPADVRLELNKLEGRIKMAYDERTEVNRDKDKTSKLIAAHPLCDMDPIDLGLIQKVDVQKLLDKKEHIKTALNNEYLNAKKTNDAIRAAHKTKCDSIRELTTKHNEKTQEKRNALNSARSYLKALNELGYSGDEVNQFCLDLESTVPALKNFTEPELEGIIDEMPDNAPMTAIDLEIAGAQEANSKYISATELIRLRKELETFTEQSGELTAKIDSSRQSISDAIKDMSSPVEGLGFNDEMLLYNGVPVSPDSLSTSEIIELGVRLKMAENPDLGILFLEHGESLGEERLKTILEIAKKNDFQVILEQVQRGQEKLVLEIIGD